MRDDEYDMQDRFNIGSIYVTHIQVWLASEMPQIPSPTTSAFYLFPS